MRNCFYCLPIHKLLSLRAEVSLSIMYWADSDVTSNEVIAPSLSAWPDPCLHSSEKISEGGAGGLTSLAHSKNKWQATKQMWHYNWVLKGLTFTKAHLYGCPYLAHWQPPIALGRAGVRRPGLGRVGAGQTQWGEPLTACGRIVL